MIEVYAISPWNYQIKDVVLTQTYKRLMKLRFPCIQQRNWRYALF